MQTRTSVVATFSLPGFHCWPTAPTEVSFLRHRHRHQFVVRAFKDITSDRETEFILLGMEMRSALVKEFGHPMELESGSCEFLADWLLVRFDLSRCEVWEDGENGSVVERC